MKTTASATLPLPELPENIIIPSHWRKRRDELLEEVNQINSINSENEFEQTEFLLKKITLLAKEADRQRKKLSEPFTIFASNIKKMNDNARMPVEQAKEKLKKMLLKFYLDHQATTGENPHKSLTSLCKKWCFETENPLLVPFEFYSLDEKKIRRFISEKKEQAVIPGIKIWHEPELRSR